MPDALVAKPVRRHQLQTLELAEVCRVSQHVDVQQLCHVFPSVVRIFFAEPFTDLNNIINNRNAPRSSAPCERCAVGPAALK